jgi:hypothetical protein
MPRLLTLSSAAFAMAACSQPTGPGISDSARIEIAADCGQDLRTPSRVHCTARLEAQGANVFALRWDMGDGREAGGMSLSYAYVASGSFTVRVRAVSQPGVWQRVATFTVPSIEGMQLKSSSD